MENGEAIEALKQINLTRVHPFYSWEEMMEVRDIAIKAIEARNMREENTSAVDAAPVVRCKDCIHRDPEDKRCDNGRWYSSIPTADDDFCSYGELTVGKTAENTPEDTSRRA